MRRWLARIAVVLLTFPGVAWAASGVNIRWSRCYSDGGAANRSFACTSNAGSETAVLALKLDHTRPNTSGIELHVLVATSNATLPAWWTFLNLGCRPSSLTANPVLPVGSLNCQDWGSGSEAGGLASFRTSTISARQGEILLAWAVPQGALSTLAANQEYFICNLVVGHEKSIGAGSCAGCSTPAVIFFDGCRIVSPPGQGTDDVVTSATNEPASQWVTWQNGSLIGLLRPTCVIDNAGGNCPLGVQTTFSVALSTILPFSRSPKAGPR